MTTLQVWIREARGNETGFDACALDFLGFATHAESEAALIQRIPSKFAWHCAWLERHGLPRPPPMERVEVAGRVAGNEVLFGTDRDPATPAEIDSTLRLLACSRADLLGSLEALPRDAFDWDPPYAHFEAWASWRTIRQILAHIANTETRYYLPTIGHETRLAPASGEGDWRAYLAAHRAETSACLELLRDSPDLLRLREEPDDQWSVRKVLRRLVWHELMHWKSIRRIAAEFDMAAQGGGPLSR